jgi:ribonucleotide reductase alpha subunit
MLIQADVLRTPAAQFISMIEVCDRLAKETGKYITGGFKPNYPVMGVDYLVPGNRVSKLDEVGVFSVAQFLWRGTREQAEEYVTKKGALIHANHSCTTPRALLEMFKEYKKLCDQQNLNIGNLHFWRNPSNNPKWIIKSAAYRGKWIDQSQSINIYFRGTSGKDLSEVYMYAWELGLKTTYYLRTLAVSQVEKSTVDTKQFGSTHMRKRAVQSEEPVVASVSVETTTIKACKIDDPTCESCQS